jgi:hypothetical protein
MVELHPLTRLEEISFLEQTGKIRKGDKPYLGYRVDKLRILEKRKTRVRRVKEAGETYIAIRGPKTGYNHLTLRATIKSLPKKRKDGQGFEVTVMDGMRL